MPGLDVFRGDGYSLTSLTDRVNKMPFVPGAIGRLGIFDEAGIATTSMEVEEQSGLLTLIPTTPRGAPGIENRHLKKTLRYFLLPHLALNETIMAEEVQGVRVFGTDTETGSVDALLNQRLAQMNAKHDATVEYGRMGALKGIILDADGATVLYNLFNEFGVTQQTVDYVLGTATTEVLLKSTAVRDLIQDELGYDGTDDLQVYCFCGKTFFDRLVTHALVKDAYKYYQSVVASANPLQMDIRYKGFTFGDVTYVRYRGVVGGISFIADNEAYAFPTNVPGLFVTRYAPADYAETVNTIGLPRYSKQAPDMQFNKFVRVETQSNPLSLCLRPRTVIKLTTSN